MSKYHIPLEPGERYHIFNHAIGDENLFRNARNYKYFLEKYSKYTEGVSDTYSYSLMPNHFHFAIRIKEEKDCVAHFEKVKDCEFSGLPAVLSDFIMERFSNLCNAYTKAYNSIFSRKGALFIDFMKRSHVRSEKYFINLMNYIHFNPVHHGFCKDPSDWEWSSYNSYLLNKWARIKKEAGLEYFGGVESFKDRHQKMVEKLPEYEFL